jgi:hypothetical protein
MGNVSTVQKALSGGTYSITISSSGEEMLIEFLCVGTSGSTSKKIAVNTVKILNI